MLRVESEERSALQEFGALDNNKTQRHEHEHSVTIDGSFDLSITEERLDSISAMFVGQQLGLSPEQVNLMRGTNPRGVLPPTTYDAEIIERANNAPSTGSLDRAPLPTPVHMTAATVIDAMAEEGTEDSDSDTNHANQSPHDEEDES